MKVRDLIRDTAWMPGRGYDSTKKPDISILLPTYRRGASGLFRKAVRSVLDQTLRNIELIIVDDASTDGTADQITEFMRRDPRVSCLRHPRNIGLPAVSEYEAFLRARADHIAFAFDDDTFFPNALEKLLAASRKGGGRIYYGSVRWQYTEKAGGEPAIARRLGSSLTASNIRSLNTIANIAVLLPRAAIERVGLYDPHVLLARVCDWDLWRRMSAHYLLEYIDIDVAEVGGPSTNDSLERTYTLNSAAAEEWMRSHRNLRPEEFPDIDVFAEPEHLSRKSRATIDDLRRGGFRHLARWDAYPKKSKIGEAKYIYVLTQVHDASTTLCFDFLPPSINGSVRVIRSGTLADVNDLANASCVVVVRDPDHWAHWTATAKRMRIPVYYFLDDNLPALVRDEGFQFHGCEQFEHHRLRMTLRNFNGVLLSTPALVEYFAAHLFHEKLYLLPVSYAAPLPYLPDKLASETLTIASIGGRHRQQGIEDMILPALRRLARPSRPIRLIVGGCWGDDLAHLSPKDEINEDLQITLIPVELDFMRAVLQLGQHRPDMLVHAPSRTLNNKYKTLNVALAAYLLDSVLVVPNDPPYKPAAFDGCAVRVDPSDEPRAWHRALGDLMEAPNTWERYRAVNAAYCRHEFSGDTSVATLREILQAGEEITPTRVEARLNDLYAAKTAAAFDTTVDMGALHTSLLELSRLRSRNRRRQRLRLAAPKDDLWPLVSPAFEDIRKHLLEKGLRRAGTHLELSERINEVPFVEYDVGVEPGRIKKVTCAFSSEGYHDGTIGIEVVNATGNIVAHVPHECRGVNFGFPVVFELDEIHVGCSEKWKFRLFARSTWPIYVFEFVTYGPFGFARRPVAPFMKIEYSERDTNAAEDAVVARLQGGAGCDCD